jgi:hypothetical protein
MPHKTQRGAILEATEEYAREGLQTIPSNSYAAEAHFAKLMRQLFYLGQLWPRWTQREKAALNVLTRAAEGRATDAICAHHRHLRAGTPDLAEDIPADSPTALLAELRAVFGDHTRLSTADILSGLQSRSGGVADLMRARYGCEMNAVQLAHTLRLLLPTDVPSKRARKWRADGKVVRGYPVEQFAGAFQRYLGSGV